MAEIFTNFLTLAFLKASLDIKSDNDKHDTKLTEILYDSNLEVDKILTPYATETPIPPGSELYPQGQTLAAMYARTRWLRDIFQFEASKLNQEDYETKKETLIATLEANKTERTETLFIPASDPLEQVYQPYNIDEYITREF